MAYISDSFNQKQDIRSYNGYIEYNNNTINVLEGEVKDKTYFEAGSPVAGMFACVQVIDKAIELKIKNLNIFSSNICIMNIAEKGWSMKIKATKKFIEFIEKKQNIKLYFNYLESSNNKIIKAKKIAMKAC